MIDLPGLSPWSADPVNDMLAPAEVALLTRIYTNHFGEGRGVLYSEPGRRSPSQRLMRSLHALGVVEFMDARAGGWERGMWGARLTCVGANAVFRADPRAQADGTVLDGHPGCTGAWLADGTCTGCNRSRPLDRAAYDSYLDALDPDDRDEQERGPRLFCIEHGRIRRRDITTTKVCRQSGTVFHDGGLMRV
jgi:hypothetical protein